MESLTIDELLFLTELVDKYLEGELDLNHREWKLARGVLNKLDTGIEALDG